MTTWASNRELVRKLSVLPSMIRAHYLCLSEDLWVWLLKKMRHESDWNVDEPKSLSPLSSYTSFSKNYHCVSMHTNIHKYFALIPKKDITPIKMFPWLTKMSIWLLIPFICRCPQIQITDIRDIFRSFSLARLQNCIQAAPIVYICCNCFSTLQNNVL